jgi:hypothetical protein
VLDAVCLEPFLLDAARTKPSKLPRGQRWPPQLAADNMGVVTFSQIGERAL